MDIVKHRKQRIQRISLMYANADIVNTYINIYKSYNLLYF